MLMTTETLIIVSPIKNPVLKTHEIVARTLHFQKATWRLNIYLPLLLRALTPEADAAGVFRRAVLKEL